MLNLIKSNRMEHLVTALCQVISQAPDNPMAPEVIGIQSRGMKQWLTTAIADYFGICANVEFVFPRELVERAMGLGKTRGTGKKAEADLPLLNRDTMAWAVMNILSGDPAGSPAENQNRPFGENGPAAYVRNDANGRKVLQLSRKIAGCFDDYQVYRPEMLADWTRKRPARPGGQDRENPHQEWQARLWQGVAALGRPLFRPTGAPPEFQDLPRRVSLFGVSALPPAFLDTFNAMGRTSDIYFFLLTPSSQFFFDQRSRRQQDRITLEASSGTGAKPGQDGETSKEPGLFSDIFADTGGNPLMAALGRTGREFHGLLENYDYHEPFDDLYEDPVYGAGQDSPPSMLALIQSDILNLVHRGQDRDEPRACLAPADSSVSVHACHSPMREAQVLKDLLLEAFDRDPDLAPHDIIVMMPDIEAYAPYLEAVLSQSPKIPYTVSDRRKRSESRTLDAFLKILALADTRLEASRVMEVLLSPVVAERFGLALEDRDRVADALVAAGVTWGKDRDHRERLTGQGIEENTWAFGLRRLMAGVAMPDGEAALVRGVLPSDGFEGLDAEVLGRTAHFLTTLFDCLNRLDRDRTPRDWGDCLKHLVRSLLETDHSNEGDIGFLLIAIDEMADQAAAGGYSRTLGFPVVRDIIEAKLDQSISQGSFLAGSLTLCNLMPMRSIPFKVVCLMGMDEQGFPRRVQPPGFDVVRSRPRPGDKQEREEDGYLFLESLISARERLIITYTGMSISDNSPVPCAGPVAELMDVMAEGFERPEGGSPQVRHPLHPFSPIYFGAGPDTPSFFSFSRAQCRIARSRQALGRIPANRTFIRPETENDHGSGALPAKSEAPVEIDLAGLVTFFRHPIQHYLGRDLGIAFPEPENPVADQDPFQVAGLEQYHLGTLSLSLWEDPEAGRRMRAAGLLPPGRKGDAEWARVRDLAGPVQAVGAGLIPEGAPGRLAVAIDLAPGGRAGENKVTLGGRVGDVYDTGRYVMGFGAITPGRLLAQWIYHLAYCLAAPNPGPTLAIGRDPKGKSPAAALGFGPVPDRAGQYLSALVRLYLKGRRQVIPFFCAPCFQLADSLLSGGWTPGDGEVADSRLESAMGRARSLWTGNRYLPGERENRYTALAFGVDDPFATTAALRASGLVDTALEVFVPLIENLSETPQ